MSVNFGRPDIERFIAETIQGTAVTAEWAAETPMGMNHLEAPKEEEALSSNMRQVRGVCTVL